MEQRPLEIECNSKGEVIRISGMFASVQYSHDGEYAILEFDSEELAREFAVTLLRKEAIRLRQEAEKAPYNMGRSHSCFVAAEALEAKIKQFVETGEWEQTLKEAVIE